MHAQDAMATKDANGMRTLVIILQSGSTTVDEATSSVIRMIHEPSSAHRAYRISIESAVSSGRVMAVDGIPKD